MLQQISDYDKHLNYLENLDGYIFKIPAQECTRVSLNPILNHIEYTIINGDKDHTAIFIEYRSQQRNRMIASKMTDLGARIDNKKDHQLHIFIIPKELYKIMTTEVKDWN